MELPDPGVGVPPPELALEEAGGGVDVVVAAEAVATGYVGGVVEVGVVPGAAVELDAGGAWRGLAMNEVFSPPHPPPPPL